MMEIESSEAIVMMEIGEMETKILVVVTEMSNLVIDKGAIVRVATNLMTRKDSMTESQVILFHQEIGSSCLKNSSAQFRSYIHQTSLNLRHNLVLCHFIIFNIQKFQFVYFNCVLQLSTDCQLCLCEIQVVK